MDSSYDKDKAKTGNTKQVSLYISSIAKSPFSSFLSKAQVYSFSPRKIIGDETPSAFSPREGENKSPSAFSSARSDRDEYPYSFSPREGENKTPSALSPRNSYGDETQSDFSSIEDVGNESPTLNVERLASQNNKGAGQHRPRRHSI